MHITPITFGSINQTYISAGQPPCKVDAPRNQFQICSPLPSWTINTSLLRTPFYSISPWNGRINGKLDGFRWFPVKIFPPIHEFHPNFPGSGRKPNIGPYRVKRRADLGRSSGDSAGPIATMSCDLAHAYIYIYIYIWLVVWNMNFIFP